MESRFWNPYVGKIVQVVLLALSFYVAWYVVPRGYGKLTNIPGTISFFATLGFPAFLVYVVGVLEILGPVLMLIPRISFYGAVPTFVIMLTASISTNDISFSSLPLKLAVVSLIVAFLARPGYLRKKKKITKISI